MDSRIKTLQKPRRKRVQKKSVSQKMILMYGIGGGLVLGLGYLAYTYFRNRAANQRSIQQPIVAPTPTDVIITPQLPVSVRGQFPLRRGAKGSLVKLLQQALLSKGGKAAMIIRETSFRNGQPDGIFGKGTEKALRIIGFPSVLSENNYTTLVSKNTATTFNGGGIAKEIIDAANKQNLFRVIQGLKKINTVAQYAQVSTYFQQVRILGTRVTSLVNALLSVAFKNKEQEKVKIRAEFTRMGLKQNPRGVWFIPGIGTLGNFDTAANQAQQQWNLAIVNKPTLLKAEDGTFIVPELLPDTVVGYITGIQNGITRILTQSGETVFAPSQNLFSV